jgi:hypothetical protein
MSERELDAQVAEKVMGLVPCANPCHDLKPEIAEYMPRPCHAQPDSPDKGGETRCYSTDISAAMEVVDRMRSLGVGVRIEMYHHYQGKCFIEMNVPSSECQEWGDTLSITICKCALKAFDKFNLAAVEQPKESI